MKRGDILIQWLLPRVGNDSPSRIYHITSGTNEEGFWVGRKDGGQFHFSYDMKFAHSQRHIILTEKDFERV